MQRQYHAVRGDFEHANRDKAAFGEMEKAKEKARFAEQAAKEAAAEAARYAAEHAKKERERLAAMAHDVPTTTFTNRTWSATLDMGDDNDNESENDKRRRMATILRVKRYVLYHFILLFYTHNIVSLS